MKKLLAGGAIVMMLFIGLGSYYYQVGQLDPLSKEAIDMEIAERYEELYKEHYKIDQAKVTELEKIEMENRIEKQLESIRAQYWAESKQETLKGVTEYIEASPEVVSLLVDFDKLESQKYSSIDEFLVKNYPSSRWIGYPVEEKCKEYGATKWQCIAMIVISGTESAFDTAYVKNDRTQAIDEGKNRNNLWGLKANRRYIDAKCSMPVVSHWAETNCRTEYSSIPYDGFAFVDFNSYESGVKWFITDTMQKGYKSVTNYNQMVGYFNASQSWADKCNHFHNILEPLLNY